MQSEVPMPQDVNETEFERVMKLVPGGMELSKHYRDRYWRVFVFKKGKETFEASVVLK